LGFSAEFGKNSTIETIVESSWTQPACAPFSHLTFERKIAATAANLLEHHQGRPAHICAMRSTENQTAMAATDRPAEMGAAHAHVPADIVGKLIVLGIVLAFSFATPAAPAARAIGARISDPQQDRQNAPSVRFPSQWCETRTN
jgi:hypothetical protein